MLYYFERAWKHFRHFWPIGLAVLIVIIATLLPVQSDASKILYRTALILVILLLCVRPLNAVYGLMGTSASISIFFINLILYCFVFSCIYFFGFFKSAGISYDINQPHVDYLMFADSSANSISFSDLIVTSHKVKMVEIEQDNNRELFYIYDKGGLTVRDTIIRVNATREYLCYQSIDYSTVLRNTFLTFLTQEPTELFSAASTYNADMSGLGDTIDRQKSEYIHWIIIFQVLIGWIFFGVFISLLYSKFRYES